MEQPLPPDELMIRVGVSPDAFLTRDAMPARHGSLTIMRGDIRYA